MLRSAGADTRLMRPGYCTHEKDGQSQDTRLGYERMTPFRRCIQKAASGMRFHRGHGTARYSAPTSAEMHRACIGRQAKPQPPIPKRVALELLPQLWCSRYTTQPSQKRAIMDGSWRHSSRAWPLAAGSSHTLRGRCHQQGGTRALCVGSTGRPCADAAQHQWEADKG